MTTREILPNGNVSTRYWIAMDGGRLRCDVCPRECRLNEGCSGIVRFRKVEIKPL